MQNRILTAAVLAAFLMPASVLAKDPPKPPHSRPPERPIGPIIGPRNPIIGIPPCLVDAKLPCETNTFSRPIASLLEGRGIPNTEAPQSKTSKKRKK